MRTMFEVVLCLILVASACNGYDSEIQPTSVATPTIVPTATPTPSAISVATETVIPSPIPLDDFMPPDPVTGVGDVRELIVQGHRFQLEVARTDSERARGLMERTSLPQDAAMLFVYGSERSLSFWMKNTLIPLDILFLNTKGVVVDVQTMQTQTGVPDGALKLYRSALPARFALEMNAGLAEALGIMPGAQVFFR